MKNALATRDFYQRPLVPAIAALVAVLGLLASVGIPSTIGVRVMSLIYAAAAAWWAVWSLRVPYVKLADGHVVVGISPARRPTDVSRGALQRIQHGRGVVDLVLHSGVKARIRLRYLRPEDRAELQRELKLLESPAAERA
jgi:hypothetical protein